MIFKLHLSDDGKPGEFIQDWEGNLPVLLAFCYRNWPEKQEHDAALEEWKKDTTKPRPKLEGRPPFEIQHPDGRWHYWGVSLDGTENDSPDEDEDDPERGFVLGTKRTCQRCRSHRVANVSGKCSGISDVSFGNVERDGYLPDDLGVGGDDYIDITYCLDCGQLQGEFPLPETGIERGENDDEDDFDDDDD